MTCSLHQLGHPLTWWFSSLSLPAFVIALVWYLCRFQRRFNDLTPQEWNHFWHVGYLTFGGWCFHYRESGVATEAFSPTLCQKMLTHMVHCMLSPVPFLVMGRVTYLHHYLPCLIFAVLCLGFMIDHFVFRSKYLSERAKTAFFIGAASAVVGVWYLYRHIAWGIEGNVNEVSARWELTNRQMRRLTRAGHRTVPLLEMEEELEHLQLEGLKRNVVQGCDVTHSKQCDERTTNCHANHR